MRKRKTMSASQEQPGEVKTPKHKAGCNFEEQVARRFGGTVGSGEISGSVGLERNPRTNEIELEMHDGWNDGVFIVFTYCPICGVPLHVP